VLDLLGDAAGHFMIRANGLELMSSRAHATEDALARLTAAAAAGVAHPRILVGGLGLGHTAEMLAGLLPPPAHVTVADISPDVIDWYRSLIAPARGIALPGWIDIVQADVSDLLSRTFDVIALDVDNGPEAFTTAGNGSLYTDAGLRRLRSSLSPGGSVLVWSGFEAEDFVARAGACGFTVATHEIPVPQNPRTSHFIYVMQAGPGPGDHSFMP
jgi:spermidine synthase